MLHPIEKKAWFLHRFIAIIAFIGFFLWINQIISFKNQESLLSYALVTLLVLRVIVELGFGYVSMLRRQKKWNTTKQES